MIPTGKRSLLATLLLLPQWFLYGSPLKPDEELVFFPAAAVPGADNGYSVELNGWVFEREDDSLWRKLAGLAGSEMMELLGVDEAMAHDPMFKHRFSWFLVDNERNKRIVARIGNEQLISERSKPNGHMAFPPLTVSGTAGSWLPVSVEGVTEAHRQIRGRVQLVAPTGLTVISDIDDTVKISEVLDRRALVKNMFTEPYKAVPGMPELYQSLQQQGAYFHYVSASPWQLFTELQAFLDSHYPQGTMSLREFRLGDQSFWDFFHSSMGYKLAAIRERIRQFPGHRFVLIGDSGEKDAEVYAEIYREFPQQVERILIRSVEHSDLRESRWERVFEGVPAERWQLLGFEVDASRVLQTLALQSQ